MSKIAKTSLALLAAGLLSTSALASSGAQDTSFLKKEKAEEAKVEMKEESMKDKYVILEGSYDFNQYDPKYTNANRTSDSFDNSGTLGARVGKMVNESVGVDFGLSFKFPTDYDFTSGTSDTYHSQVKTTRLMLNGTYDFGAVSTIKLAPYVTAGLGGAYNKYSTTTKISGTSTSYSNSDWKFAYTLGAGLSYKLPNEAKIKLGYRFSDDGDAYKISGVTTERLQSHDIVLGVQIPF